MSRVADHLIDSRFLLRWSPRAPNAPHSKSEYAIVSSPSRSGAVGFFQRTGDAVELRRDSRTSRQLIHHRPTMSPTTAKLMSAKL